MNATWLANREIDVPEMNVSNELLEDREALNRAMNRDGYLFFKGVLDIQAVERLKSVYVEELASLNVVNAGDSEGRYNGGDLGDLPETPVSGILEDLFKRAPWREFVADPAISSVAKKILGDEPFWVPILGYRIAKPGADPASERFDFVHQDAFFNVGIPFLNFWVPLVDMDSEVGGLAIAEGVHKVPSFHNLGEPPAYLIPPGAIPQSAWRFADYQPGDLLVLHINTPHSGITNISQDRFRMSLDVRMVGANSGDVPVIGGVVEISPEQIAVRSEDGEISVMVVDDTTYCRGNHFVNGARVAASELPSNYHAGDEVIVAVKEGRATVIRPASY